MHLDEARENFGGELEAVISGLDQRVSQHILRVDRLPRESDFHYECLKLPVLPSTSLCLFNHRMLMNASLARASYYSEVERRVLNPREFIDEVKESRAEGYNMSAATLGEFLERKRLARPGGVVATDPGDLEPLLPSEEAFLNVEERYQKEFLGPFAQQEGGGYLIATTAGAGLREILSHEIQHAQFFHDAAFREVVVRYWNETLSAEDKAAFRKALEGSYDVGDERVMQDEFQAYMIMPKVPLESLVPVAAKHRGPLLAAIRDAGLGTYVVTQDTTIAWRGNR